MISIVTDSVQWTTLSLRFSLLHVHIQFVCAHPNLCWLQMCMNHWYSVSWVWGDWLSLWAAQPAVLCLIGRYSFSLLMQQDGWCRGGVGGAPVAFCFPRHANLHYSACTSHSYFWYSTQTSFKAQVHQSESPSNDLSTHLHHECFNFFIIYSF